MTRLSALVLAASLGAIGGPSWAETENALYDAPVPADAVFLRRLGAMDAPFNAFGQTFTADMLPEDTFAAISADSLETAEAGGHYSIVDGPGGRTLVQEPNRENASKVYLYLINSDLGDARLVVADGGPVVIDATQPGQVGARAVNPLALTLAVETESGSEDFAVVLRQGTNLTFHVQAGQVRMIEDQTGPVIDIE